MSLMRTFYVPLFVFSTYLTHVHLLTYGRNDTATFLLNLASYAIESRQNRYPYQFKYPPYYQKPTGQYGVPQYPLGNTNLHPHLEHFTQQSFVHQYPGNRPYRPDSLETQQNQKGIMEVLYSIARNDKLRCVQRLLCEATADTLSRRRQLTLPTLPFNINIESIIGLLATIDVGNTSPIPTFAKAALLGYISKGNSDKCLSAYPTCPSDPDKLVQYLNNYNGGFFRFFNGISPQPTPQYSPQFQNYGGDMQNSPYRNLVAEQRIQNKPAAYIPNKYPGNDATSIPNHISSGNFNLNKNRSPKTLIFPNDDGDDFNEFTFRKPKELPFSINHYHSNELDLQRPLPNHHASPMIFPDRTGTGDLRLDTEELNENYKQTQHNLQNNFISFNPSSNEGFYYRTPEAVLHNNPKSPKAIFNFPV